MYKCHFSGKMFITLPPSPLLNVFKANYDNNTLNPPPPFHIKNHGSENKYKINMQLVHIYIKIKIWVSFIV